MYVCLSVHGPRRAQRSTNQANTTLARDASILASCSHPPPGDAERAYAALMNTTTLMLFSQNHGQRCLFRVFSIFMKFFTVWLPASIHWRSSPHTVWAAMGWPFPLQGWGFLSRFLGSHPGHRASLGGLPYPESGPHAQAISLGESGGRSGKCRAWARTWARLRNGRSVGQASQRKPKSEPRMQHSSGRKRSLPFLRAHVEPRFAARCACARIFPVPSPSSSRNRLLTDASLKYQFCGSCSPSSRTPHPRLPRAPVRSRLCGQTGTVADFPIWFLQIQARWGGLLLLLLVCLVFRKSEFIKEGAAPNFYHFRSPLSQWQPGRVLTAPLAHPYFLALATSPIQSPLCSHRLQEAL